MQPIRKMEPIEKIEDDGTIKWYQNVKLHREDGTFCACMPAQNYLDIIYPDGTEEWYFNRELHRENGPAIIKSDGTEIYYSNGLIHRLDGTFCACMPAQNYQLLFTLMELDFGLLMVTQ